MKKISFVLMTMVFAVCMAGMVYAADTIKVGAKIEEKYLKNSYDANDKIIVDLTVDEGCSKLGLIMGAFEYDATVLEVSKLTKGSFVVDEDAEDGGSTNTKFFEEGLGDKSNQIIFWVEDAYNRLQSGSIGKVTFTVKNQVKLKDIKLSYAKVNASDYNESVRYQYTQTINNNSLANNPADNKDESDDLDEIKNEKRKEERAIIDSLLNSIEEKENNKKNNENKTKETVKSVTWSNASNWAVKELEESGQKGLIPETLDNKDFTKAVTRKDFAAVAVKLYEKMTNSVATPATDTTFTDTKDEYVLKAYNLGITEGTSKEKALFSPDNEITREQLATMMLRAITKAGIDSTIDLNTATKFVDDDLMHDWSRTAIYYMNSQNIINGISTSENRYGVKNTATIEQALAISLRTLKTVAK